MHIEIVGSIITNFPEPTFVFNGGEYTFSWKVLERMLSIQEMKESGLMPLDYIFSLFSKFLEGRNPGDAIEGAALFFILRSKLDLSKDEASELGVYLSERYVNSIAEA